MIFESHTNKLVKIVSCKNLFRYYSLSGITESPKKIDLNGLCRVHFPLKIKPRHTTTQVVKNGLQRPFNVLKFFV